jgi:hypothetical protein
MIAAAEAARPVDAGFFDGLVIGLGLLFQDPGVQLGTAQLAFESGNPAGASEAAARARDAWRFAADAGAWRVLSIFLLALSLGLFIRLARARRARHG